MLKKLSYLSILLILLLAPHISLFANQVPIEEAARIAKDVYARNATTSRSVQQIRVLSQFSKKVKDQPSYYIFNLQPTGFVIISAEDRYNPILAFSEESHVDFEAAQANIGLFGTLSKHEQRIEYIRAHDLKPSKTITKEWQQLREGTATRSARRNVVVRPLTTTKWNQGRFYNAECPANAETAEVGPDGRTYCGCVPIAMAQLIKFHNFPAQGNGSNEYLDNTFGLLSGDFCNTTYNWENMPDELDRPNADVAQLIYQMGVSVNTQYSVEYTETYFSYVRDAYVNYFGYDNAARWFYDRDYTGFAVVAKQDLDRGLPLLLTGTSLNLVGHTWVTDGYGYFSDSDAAEYFHFNWGWGGSNNGWFLDSSESWAPLEGQGEDVQEIVYYWDRYVLHNLYPAAQACQAPPNKSVYADGIQANYSYVYLSNPSLAQEISFRYKEAGTNEWINTDATSGHYAFLQNLEQGTTYEFQARQKCCPEIWSDYTEVKTFTTKGERQEPTPDVSTCKPVSKKDLTTSSLGENNGYIYTSQPDGAVNNQFRYRVVGTTDWTTTDISNSYYRYLSGLQSGSQYEFQVKQECAPEQWSDYSASQTFNTLSGTITCTAIFFADNDGDGFGDPNNGTSGCQAPNGYVSNADDCDDSNPNVPTTPGAACTGGIIAADGCTCTNDNSSNACSPVSSSLTTSSISDNNAYIYTPQPNGAVNNQFRYRPINTTDWSYTDISTTYYRYLSGLLAGTTYEFQASQQCLDGTYSSYSTTYTFTTTGVAKEDGNSTDNNSNGNNGNSNGNGNNGNSNGNGNNGNSNGDGNNGDNFCPVLDVAGLYVSSVGQAAAYLYTPQPLGKVNNMFRYRAVGTDTWVNTNISTSYYRYATGLKANTSYEYQVTQECAADLWSEFSDSYIFTTLGNNFQTEDTPEAPHSYTAFRQLAISTTSEQLRLAPNPAVHEITLSTKGAFAEEARLIVYNTQGKVVKEIALATEQQQQRVDIANLNAGIYLLQYRTDTVVQTMKFVKR